MKFMKAPEVENRLITCLLLIDLDGMHGHGSRGALGFSIELQVTDCRNSTKPHVELPGMTACM
jgi:hypothetical protein